MPTETARRKLAIAEREPLPENLFRSVVAHAPLVAIDLVVQDHLLVDLMVIVLMVKEQHLFLI